MKNRNYCLIIMGDTKGFLEEVLEVTEGEPNVLNAKGIIISTFTSDLTVRKLNKYFTDKKRSFFVFELDPSKSGFNFTKKEIHNGLFGFLDESVKGITSIDLMRAIKLTSDTKDDNTVIKKNKKYKLTKEKVEKMPQEEKTKIMNMMLDEGLENLSEEDKVILQFLAK